MLCPPGMFFIIWRSMRSFSRIATPLSIKIGGGVASKFDLKWGGLVTKPYRLRIPSRPQLNNKPEIRWWFQHVNSGDFQANRFELSQQIKIHKVFMAKKTGALPPSVNGRCLDDKFDLRQRCTAILFFVVGCHDRS